MQPNSEPTPADVAMVAAAMGEPAAPAPTAAPVAAPAAPAPQPTPAPAPAPQQQPAPVTPQPAPSQQQTDPFASLFASEPAAPTAPEPQAPAQPTQPTEPASPTTPQPQQPTEPTQPTPQAPAQPAQPAPAAPVADEYQTFDEYMESITQGLPPAPAAPDPDKIDPNNPEAIKTFFDDLVNTAVQKSNAQTQRQQAITTAERTLWEGAFTKYNSLRDNKPLRDMVHSIRMGYFQRGVAITPTQAADKLLDAMKAQYQRGVADNQVTTTIESVQPQGGGGTTPVPTTLDEASTLTAVQTGGEVALAAILDAEIKAGRTW